MTNAHSTTSSPNRGPRLSAADKHQRDRYLREFIPAIVTFWILLAVVLNTVDEQTYGARLWVLLPVLPMIGVAVALYRAVQRADEYGRVVLLECMALGFGAAMVASLALGFLGIIGEAWTFGGWLVFGIGMTTWTGSLLVRNLR
ncbi:MAG: hypothetical protein H6513_09290 [Acidimicrobiaceae bacterium]|nr:hypothetical protein [Ilumatobacter sp.]MCB9380869.1 hypothetical protein [Acidimicrobiaceae bacterium]MCO5329852.1 hypothetical protein [Ilumatobacteraceae bacterium]